MKLTDQLRQRARDIVESDCAVIEMGHYPPGMKNRYLDQQLHERAANRIQRLEEWALDELTEQRNEAVEWRDWTSVAHIDDEIEELGLT